MNRREMMIGGIGAAATMCVSGRAVAGNVFAPQSLCVNQGCINFLEATAREIMVETGEWKQGIIRSRSVKRMLVSRWGCCGCEITLPENANHPDWQYVRRNLTLAEKESFHREYGQQAPLLLGLEVSPGLKVRGFILDGREMGWNLSVERVV